MEDLPTGLEGYARADARLVDLVHRAREFRRRYIDPVAAELDRRMLDEPGYHPDDVVRRGCEFGFLSLPIPRFVGGGGMGTLHTAVLLEELCAGCGGIANIFGAHYLGLSAVLAGFDLSEFERWLREVADAEKKGVPLLWAAAVTEPSAGTDIEDPELLARARFSARWRKVTGGYRLDGRKVFISNGSVARNVVVGCAADPAKPVETWAAFVVPAGAPGFSVGRLERKLGQRACHAAELVFEDCFVPADARLGVLDGRGAEVTSAILAASRGPVAAISVGIARGAYEVAVELAGRRRGGKGALWDRQWAQQLLADMQARLVLARGAYLEATQWFDTEVAQLAGPAMQVVEAALTMTSPLRATDVGAKVLGHPAVREAMATTALDRLTGPAARRSLGLSSLAKFSASDLAVGVCLDALELAGAAGGEERLGLEKRLRDARLTQIYEGTNQLNRWETFKALVRGTP